jgi:AbrB family looped-hinge helix DNA binding protein
MGTTILSTKGQVVIPRDVRRRHGWRRGTKIQVEDRGDCVILRPQEDVPATTLEDLVGCTGYRGPRRSLEDMNDAIARASRRKPTLFTARRLRAPPSS